MSERGWDLLAALRAGVQRDPFAGGVMAWDATTAFLLRMGLLSSGASTLGELDARLDAVAELLEMCDRSGSTFCGFAVDGVSELSLVFGLLAEEHLSPHYSEFELHGALALWHLAEASDAASVGDAADVEMHTTQACIAIAFAMGLGGRTVTEGELREQRSQSARVGASALHKARGERKRRCLEEFDSSPELHRNKELAAERLATKYHFSFFTVRDWLKGR